MEVGRSLGERRFLIKEVKKSNAPGVFFKHKFDMWDVLVAFRSLLNRDRLKTFAVRHPEACVEILRFPINISEFVWLH